MTFGTASVLLDPLVGWPVLYALAALATLGSTKLVYQGVDYDLAAPFTRISMQDAARRAVREYVSRGEHRNRVAAAAENEASGIAAAQVEAQRGNGAHGIADGGIGRLAEMSGRYLYFRPGDAPALDFERVDP